MNSPLSFTEKEVQQKSVAALRSDGWLVKVLASDKRKRKGEMGLPDAIAFKHGTTLLLEFKSASGALEPSQSQFSAQILEHETDTLRYMVVYHPSQLRGKWIS